MLVARASPNSYATGFLVNRRWKHNIVGMQSGYRSCSINIASRQGSSSVTCISAHLPCMSNASIDDYNNALSQLSGLLPRGRRRRSTPTYIGMDANGVVGCNDGGHYDGTIGGCTVGNRDKCGQALLTWCQENFITLASTFSNDGCSITRIPDTEGATGRQLDDVGVDSITFQRHCYTLLDDTVHDFYCF